MITLGVLSDTHIPDRAQHLHPQIIPIFKQAGVQTILHAGDVSTPAVLTELRQVGTVYAVRGNRDWFSLRDLPDTQALIIAGVPIILTHGHGGWLEYVRDKYYWSREGYRLERYQPRLRRTFPDARVIVFGHTHTALNLWVDGQLFFNPGSPHFPEDKNAAPSLGLLHIEAGGRVAGELIQLE